MKKHELIKQLEAFDDDALVFVDGCHGYGIEEANNVKATAVSTTGDGRNGDILRIYEEREGGTQAIYIRRR